MKKRKFILYADDDTDDRSWVSEAFLVINSSIEINFVENGKEVLGYLETLTPDALPQIIVLDLNMPEMDGRQTLQRLKANTDYQHIQVAVVTTSDNRMDKEVCSRLGASLHLIKPNTLEGWQGIVRQLEDFMS